MVEIDEIERMYIFTHYDLHNDVSMLVDENDDVEQWIVMAFTIALEIIEKIELYAM